MRRFRRPYRIRKKKSIFKNRLFWLGIFLLIIFVGIFYLIFFFPPFQIRGIEISGNKKITAESLKILIEEKIGQKFLFFSSQSIFLAKPREIEKEILKNFPQIEKITLKRKFPDRLSLQIKEREARAIFSFNDKYFFIDKEGIIFEEVRGKNSLFKIRNLTLLREPRLGDRVMEKEKINQILTIESKFKNIILPPIPPSEESSHLKIAEASIVSDERLNIKTVEGWEIYFNLKEDLNWQITKLNLVLKERIPPQRRKNLQYIDLRFEKVYIFPES